MSNKISHLLQRYQTRKQLRRLPEYRLNDIGKIREAVDLELDKNSFLALVNSFIKEC